MNIFDFLETCLEPKLNNIKFNELEPPETVKKFIDSGLFKKIPITEADCNECPENCRGLNAEVADGKLIHTCPTGFLETPRELSPEETQGWQFDFSRLAELICDKSKLKYGGHNEVNDFKAIAYDEINGKTITVVYHSGLSGKNGVIDLARDCFSLSRTDLLVLITPSLDIANTLKQLENIYPITLKTVLEKDFNAANIVNEIIAESEIKTPVQFPLPDGLLISNVTILFDSPNINTGSTPEWIKVSYPGRSQRFHYAEIGCKDKKTGNYDKQWEILYTFAQKHGVISWDMFRERKGKPEISSAEDEENNDSVPAGPQIRQRPKGGIPFLEKRIQALRQILKQLLNIREDPFLPYSPKAGYKTKFKIEIAEEDSHPEENI